MVFQIIPSKTAILRDTFTFLLHSVHSIWSIPIPYAHNIPNLFLFLILSTSPCGRFRVQFGNGVLTESVLSRFLKSSHLKSLSLNLSDKLLSVSISRIPYEPAASVLLSARHPFLRNVPRLFVRSQFDLWVPPR